MAKKKGFFRIFSSKLFLFLLIFLFAGMAKVTIEKYLEASKAKEILGKEQARITEKEKKNKDLEDKLKYFQSKEYIENLAKEKLNLVKPGEKLIYILPKEEKEQKEEELKQKEEKMSLFESLKGIFIKEEKKD